MQISYYTVVELVIRYLLKLIYKSFTVEVRFSSTETSTISMTIIHRNATSGKVHPMNTILLVSLAVSSQTFLFQWDVELYKTDSLDLVRWWWNYILSRHFLVQVCFCVGGIFLLFKCIRPLNVSYDESCIPGLDYFSCSYRALGNKSLCSWSKRKSPI